MRSRMRGRRGAVRLNASFLFSQGLEICLGSDAVGARSNTRSKVSHRGVGGCLSREKSKQKK